MSNLYVSFVSESTADAKVLIMFTGGTTVRPGVASLLVSPATASAQDYQVQYELRRTTADGANGTTPPKDPVDPGSPGAEVTMRGSLTGANLPTYDGTPKRMLVLGKPMRIPYRWVADPRGEIIVPATANAGIALHCLNSTTAYTELADLRWFE